MPVAGARVRVRRRTASRSSGARCRASSWSHADTIGAKSSGRFRRSCGRSDRNGRPRPGVGVKRRPHRLEPAVQAGLGGAQRDPQGLGDFRQRQVEVEMQHDDRPLLGRRDGGSRARAGRGRRSPTRRRRGGQVQVGDVDVDLERPTAEASDLVDAGIHQLVDGPRRRTDPGSRSVGRSRQARTRAFWTASDARSAIPEHEPGGRAEAGDRGACQHGEGVMIALSALAQRALDSSRPRRRRGSADRVHRVWRPVQARGFNSARLRPIRRSDLG